ncbi:MAG TPA: 16S rRNA (cytosine(967)-C(5))-methyltransferase RsmB [Clostridiales bacterium]|nr:16S rRNA (cytosine(967)-C(5))-methyltransferase RsmB [Clostridiales bacterium]
MVTGRQAALFALSKCRRAGAWSEMAADIVIREHDLSRREAALCSRIVYGVLQNRTLLDFYIDCYSGISTGRLEPKVLDILRLSAYQILFMDRIPASAAVSEGVELCKSGNSKKAVGLVNAVLRRIAENRDGLPEIPGRGTSGYLSVRYSHPLWLAQELTARHGYDFAESFFSANNIQPPLSVQTNTLNIAAEALAARLAEGEMAVSPGMTPDSFAISDAGRVTGIPEFTEGLFYVQDDAARRAVIISGAAPGMNVLDACAAPGGKSFAAAIQMGNAGTLISCDLHAKKLHRISEGAQRLGIDIIHTRAMDAGKPDSDLMGWADVVLADVPCSGLGVIRKKPEIRYKNPAELERLPQVQAAILDGLAGCVKPGGVLLYSTCTIRKCENEDVICRFTGSRGDFTVAEMETLWPHIHGTDGFFICKLIKSI